MYSNAPRGFSAHGAFVCDSKSARGYYGYFAAFARIYLLRGGSWAFGKFARGKIVSLSDTVKTQGPQLGGSNSGNGNSDRERSNAHTVDWGGNAWYAGDVTNGNGVSLDGLNTNMSDVQNSSVTYGVNSYCIYNNKLWKCKVQHKNQPPTEGTYWTACTISGEISELNSNLDILLSITTNNFDYVENFSGNENADNAPMGIRKGQSIIGHPSRFEEWVMYQTYYYDSGHQYGWQLAFNMNGNGIAYRYKRNSTWNDWAYLVLES